jgi:hypothetical protein
MLNKLQIKPKIVISISTAILAIIILLCYFYPKNRYDTAKWENPVVIVKQAALEAGKPIIEISGEQTAIVMAIDDDFNGCDDRTAVTFSEGVEFRKIIYLSKNNFAKTPPQMCGDKTGCFHIIWGERPGFINSRPGQPSSDILYTKYEHGYANTPENIFHLAVTKPMAGFSNFKIFSDSFNNPVVFFISSLDSSSMPSLNYTKKVKGNWQVNKLIEMADDFTGVTDKNNVFHIAFISPYKFQETKSKGIYYVCSKNDFKNFSDPVTVYKFNTYKPSSPKILIDNYGTIHMVWSMVTGKRTVPDAIFHSCSIDGINWSTAEKVSTNNFGNCINPVLLLDSKNKIHLLWQYSESFPSKPSCLMYSFWDGNCWKEPVKLFDNISAPSAVIDDKDYLHLVFRDLRNRDKRPYQLVYFKTKMPVTQFTF